MKRYNNKRKFDNENEMEIDKVLIQNKASIFNTC
jgi:hypothetical protein